MTIERKWQYWIWVIGLALVAVGASNAQFAINSAAHTNLELVSVMLAFFVGALALVRYYSREDSLYLFLGLGFLGTAFLDANHALVTSEGLRAAMPSAMRDLIPWSWVGSRVFLALMLTGVWVYQWKRFEIDVLSPKRVYAFSIASVVVFSLFLATTELPSPFSEAGVIHRPYELVPALLFAFALWGFLRQGHWRNRVFSHWLVISLLIAIAAQLWVMPFSAEVFDAQFTIAHALKILSYGCVLTGLLANIYFNFQKERESVRLVSQQNEALFREIASSAEMRGQLDDLLNSLSGAKSRESKDSE